MKNAFISNFLLPNLINKASLANADIFVLAFLHKIDMWKS